MPRFCRPILDSDGNRIGIACGHESSHTCSSCKRSGARKRCDFPLQHGGTCDRWLCSSCAIVQSRNGSDTVDFCPAHDRLWKEQHKRKIAP
jgi:hypothetical protein